MGRLEASFCSFSCLRTTSRRSTRAWRCQSWILMGSGAGYFIYVALDHPARSWDMIPCVMAILNDSVRDVTALHAEAWKLIKARVPKEAFRLLPTGDIFREKLHADAAAMHDRSCRKFGISSAEQTTAHAFDRADIVALEKRPDNPTATRTGQISGRATLTPSCAHASRSRRPCSPCFEQGRTGSTKLLVDELRRHLTRCANQSPDVPGTSRC